MKYQTRLAKLFNSKTNFIPFEATIGKVISPPPNLRISIWNGDVILEPYQLYMNDRLFNDHTRQYSLEGEITEQTMKVSTSQLTGEGSRDDPSHNTHKLESWSGSGTYKATGTIVNTDTLKKDDLVKLTPTEDGQIWFVDFKIRKLGE
jgi:hypothetical protein